MTMASAAKEYGAALFELALEANACDAAADGLRIITTALREEPAYIELLASPAIPLKERLSLIKEAFSQRVSEQAVFFLYLLCENGRIREIFDCAEVFDRLYRESQKVSTAQVISAIPLSAEEQERLKNTLESKTGRSVTLACSVDPTLIGGIVVEWDGKRLDSSLKRRLQVIKEVIDQ